VFTIIACNGVGGEGAKPRAREDTETIAMGGRIDEHTEEEGKHNAKKRG
jgi:hypothetical protein